MRVVDHLRQQAADVDGIRRRQPQACQVGIQQRRLDEPLAVIEDAGGGGMFVSIPFDVEAAFGKKRVKVIATIDGVLYRGSLMRMGGPCHILGVLKDIRRQIGKGLCDQVHVTVAVVIPGVVAGRIAFIVVGGGAAAGVGQVHLAVVHQIEQRAGFHVLGDLVGLGSHPAPGERPACSAYRTA